MEVSRDYLSSLITSYFNMGLQCSEIRAFLCLRHNITVSGRQLRRLLKSSNLWRRKRYSDTWKVYNFLKRQVEGSSCLHGYKWMHLKCIQHGFVVTQDTVRRLLQIVDPDGVNFRRRRRLRRRNYFNKGPNYLWHVDSYDKLKPYGIAINGCIDGFSRHIIWLNAGYTNNNPRVILGYYVKAVESCHGCPRTLRTDLGTENSHIEEIHTFFRQNLHHQGNVMPPFLYGTSQHNQRIEAWWSILRKHNAQYWINFFENLKNNNDFNGTFLDKALIQYCFMHLIQEELDEVVLEWNTHNITSRRNCRAPTGRPISMYNLPELHDTSDYLVFVPQDQIQATKDVCLFIDKCPCDIDVYNLCCIICEEKGYRMGNNPDAARILYLHLRNELYNLLL